MTKDIGYYVDFLPADKLEEIRQAHPAALTRAISALAIELADFTPISQVRLIDNLVYAKLNNNPQKITAMLRGLCDEVDKRFTR
jgi:predicted component of type VI protein secretion system